MSITLKKEKTNVVSLLSFLCPLIYFASYLTRKDYSIVMDAIISQELINENMAGLVETLGVISYGIGQVISGILGDRFKPQKLIMCGLGVTVLCNIAMPFTPAAGRGALWFINGFAQSMLWPPLVRIMAAVMDEKKYNTVASNVNVAGISGTIFIYITSSLIWLKYFDSWKLTFFTSAIITAIILVLWIVGFKKITKTSDIHFERKKSEEKTDKSGKKLSFKLILGSGFIFIALAIIAQGALRDGITDWVPTLLRNTFEIPSSYAILYSVIIPIIGVISMKIVGIAANKWVKEELNGSLAVFIAAAILCTVLYLIYTRNQYVTVAVAAIIVGAMWAINFFLVCVVPAKFEKYGIVSTMSGIINSLTYVGTSLAVTGFPSLTKDGDWGLCIFVWIFIAAFGAIMCIAGVRAWKRFKSE
ncbi:MAG: MFS transporter [Oscillospiraceae bacterium]|nr:MFS transporter [Oscillospiraceae bacterium]